MNKIVIETEIKGNDIEVKIKGGGCFAEIMAAAEALNNLCINLAQAESEEK